MQLLLLMVDMGPNSWDNDLLLQGYSSFPWYFFMYTAVQSYQDWYESLMCIILQLVRPIPFAKTKILSAVLDVAEERWAKFPESNKIY